VAELMIPRTDLGRWLSDRRTAGIYRSQALGRVRMSTTPAAHEAMGVSHYAWSTSPLRRYVDLVNQRQLIACVRNEAALYAGNDADLFAIVSAFDAAYGRAEFRSAWSAIELALAPTGEPAPGRCQRDPRRRTASG
jgi:exoribonuclease-2